MSSSESKEKLGLLDVKSAIADLEAGATRRIKCSTLAA